MEGCLWFLLKGLTHLAGWWWAHHALPLGAAGGRRPHRATLLLLRHHLRGRSGGPIHGPIVMRCLLLQLGIWVEGGPLQQELGNQLYGQTAAGSAAVQLAQA